MTSASVLKAAERTFDLYGLFGISVEGVLDQTVLEACRSSERLEPYRQIRLSPSNDFTLRVSRSSLPSIARTSLWCSRISRN
jgi:hypothetical protein